MATPTLDQFLLYAAMAGDLGGVKQRLASGASPLYMDSDKGSALMQACRRGDLEIAQHLLNAGADPNAILESTGLSAVQYADRYYRHDLVDACCGHGGIRPPKDERLCNLIIPFETNCVFGCCGWHAFDFSPEGVVAVSAGGVSLKWLRDEALRGIEFLRGLEHWIRLNDEVCMGREDIPQLEELLRSVDQVEGRSAE